MNGIAVSSFKLVDLGFGRNYNTINHLWRLLWVTNWTLPSSARQHRASRSTGTAAGNSTSRERWKERLQSALGHDLSRTRVLTCIPF